VDVHDPCPTEGDSIQGSSSSRGCARSAPWNRCLTACSAVRSRERIQFCCSRALGTWWCICVCASGGVWRLGHLIIHQLLLVQRSAVMEFAGAACLSGCLAVWLSGSLSAVLSCLWCQLSQTPSRSPYLPCTEGTCTSNCAHPTHEIHLPAAVAHLSSLSNLHLPASSLSFLNTTTTPPFNTRPRPLGVPERADSHHHQQSGDRENRL